MEKFKKIGIIVLIVLIAVGLVKNTLIKTVVTAAASGVVGAPVHIDSLAVGVFKQSVQIKGFKLYNPAGYPKELMLDIPEIRVDYDLLGLLTGKLHCSLIILDLKEMVIVKDKEGKLNVDALKVAQKGQEPAKKQEAQKPAKEIGLRIDEARLNLGQVVVKDFTKGEPPAIQAYDIGVHDKVFKDINSAEQFAALIMVQAMGPTALKSAGIYGAASVLGVAFLPAGVAGVLLGKDSGAQEYGVSFEKAYSAAKEAVQVRGQIITEDPVKGFIKAKVDGSDVKIQITTKDKNKVAVDVSARQMMLPKPEVAQGVLYQISEKLK